MRSSTRRWIGWLIITRYMNKVKNSADVYRIVSEPLLGSIQEKLILITLNVVNGVLGTHVMAIGSDTEVTISTKLIVRQALLDVACGIVLVHNHPSGDVHPSVADIKVTERLKQACNVMDISLIDHVIVSNDKWYSFADEEEHSI